MLSPRTRQRLIVLLGILAGALLAAVGGAASPALAHDELLGSEPAAGAVLEVLPGELTLTFSGVLLSGDGATAMAVTDSAGTDLTAGAPVLDGVRLTQPLSGEAVGVVDVTWRVVSSDGHPISGEFSFSVGDGSSPGPSASPSAEPTAGAGELLPVWIAVGAIAVVAVAAIVLLARRRPSDED